MTGRALTASVTGVAWLAMSTGAGAEVFVYPKQGIGQEQMRQDQFECHNWAKAQTGFDPSQQAVYASPGPAPASGGALGGAARGATVGVIGGAIGGDAGKGAAIGAGVGAAAGLLRRGAYNRQAADVAAQSQGQQQANLDRYERSYAACMAGRGYQVG
ncbi:MAG TPA: glycine zipper family protein [Candidatus Acidoferrum sp.]|jgi:hypothetical protein|nr:glycine zipper family protein [Candidatus Acidoferrum sp.]